MPEETRAQRLAPVRTRKPRKAERPTAEAPPDLAATPAAAEAVVEKPKAAVMGRPKAGPPPGKRRKARRRNLFEDMADEPEEEEAEETEIDTGGEEASDLISGRSVAIRRKKRRRRVPAGTVVRKKKKKARRRDERVKPSPPLEKTDPLGDYLAGQMVPCPVGCGGFSEVVRVASLESGEGEVWFECLSCAQRRQFRLPRATRAENAEIAKAEELSREIHCPRHKVPVALRRRGRQFVCPSCGVVFSP